MKHSLIATPGHWFRRVHLIVLVMLLVLTGCADNLIETVPTEERAANTAQALRFSAIALVPSSTPTATTPTPTPTPTLPPIPTPAPPPILIPPTPNPPPPGRAIAPDTVGALRPVRRIGFGEAVDAAIVPRDQVLAVMTTGGIAWFELPSLEHLRFDPVVGGVRAVEFNRSGRLAAVFPANPVEENAIQIRQVSDGSLLATLPGSDPALGPEGEFVATVQAEEPLKTQLWRSEDGTALSLLEGGSPVFSPDGQYIATVQGQGTGQPATLIWRTSDGSLLLDLPGDTPTYSPSGQMLATVTSGAIQLWSMSDGRPAGSLTPETGTYENVQMAFSEDDKLLRVLTDAGLQVWSVPTLTRVADYPLETAAAGRESRLSTAGEILTTLFTTADGATQGVQLIRANDGSVIFQDNQVRRGAVSDDQFTAAFVAASGLVQVVDLNSGEVQEMNLPAFTSLALSPDGRVLATARPGTNVDLWQVVDRTFLGRLTAVPGSLRVPQEIAFSPDGRTLIAIEDLGASSGVATSVWPVQAGSAGTEILRLTPGNERISPGGWDFSPAINASAWVDGRGRVLLRDVNGETETLIGAGAVTALEFIPDGTLLAAGDQAGTVQILKTEGGYIYDTLQAGGAVADLAFSPDGRLLAARLADSTVVIWQVDEQVPLVRIATDQSVEAFFISTDNQMLVAGGPNGVVFYQLVGGQQLSRLDVAAQDISIDPVGRLLAVLHDDRVTVWGVP